MFRKIATKRQTKNKTKEKTKKQEAKQSKKTKSKTKQNKKQNTKQNKTKNQTNKQTLKKFILEIDSFVCRSIRISNIAHSSQHQRDIPYSTILEISLMNLLQVSSVCTSH